MKTSCRFAMAVHVLAVLAYKEGQRVTSAKLARSVNTNPVVIRRLLLALQAAHLVETRMGARSGSCLARPPAQVRLDEVYRAVEAAEPFTMPREKPNAACPVGHCIQKALLAVFNSAERALERELAQTNLGDIVDMVKTECQRAAEEANSTTLATVKANPPELAASTPLNH